MSNRIARWSKISIQNTQKQSIYSSFSPDFIFPGFHFPRILFFRNIYILAKKLSSRKQKEIFGLLLFVKKFHYKNKLFPIFYRDLSCFFSGIFHVFFRRKMSSVHCKRKKNVCRDLCNTHRFFLLIIRHKRFKNYFQNNSEIIKISKQKRCIRVRWSFHYVIWYPGRNPGKHIWNWIKLKWFFIYPNRIGEHPQYMIR